MRFAHFGQNRARAQRSARPPSRGNTGSRLKAPCTSAQTATRGNIRKVSTSSRLPAGPARAQTSSLPLLNGSVSITAPPALMRMPQIRPPRRSIAAPWHSSWNAAAASADRSQFSGSVSSRNAPIRQAETSTRTKSRIRKNFPAEVFHRAAYRRPGVQLMGQFCPRGRRHCAVAGEKYFPKRLRPSRPESADDQQENQKADCRQQQGSAVSLPDLRSFDSGRRVLYPVTHVNHLGEVYERGVTKIRTGGKSGGCHLTIGKLFIIIPELTGCGEAWYRAWFGSKRPRVRIPTLRPNKEKR